MAKTSMNLNPGTTRGARCPITARMGFALGGLLFGHDNNVISGAVDALVFPKAKS